MTSADLVNFETVQEAVAEALGNRQGPIYLYLRDSHGRTAAVSNVTVEVCDPERVIGDDPVASVFLDIAELDHGPMVCLPADLAAQGQAAVDLRERLACLEMLLPAPSPLGAV